MESKEMKTYIAYIRQLKIANGPDQNLTTSYEHFLFNYAYPLFIWANKTLKEGN